MQERVRILRLMLSVRCRTPARCVGWYHSHPHFEAQPSIIDIKNQVLQQHQARDGDEEPYIGVCGNA